jgi:hypothetical protein
MQFAVPRHLALWKAVLVMAFALPLTAVGAPVVPIQSAHAGYLEADHASAHDPGAAGGNTDKYRFEVSRLGGPLEIEPKSIRQSYRPGDEAWVDLTPPDWPYDTAEQYLAQLNVELPATVVGSTWEIRLCNSTGCPVIYNNIFTLTWGNVVIGSQTDPVRVKLRYTGKTVIDGSAAKSIMARFRVKWFYLDNTQPEPFAFMVNGANPKPVYTAADAPDGKVTFSVAGLVDKQTEVSGVSYYVNDIEKKPTDDEVTFGNGANIKLSAHVWDAAGNWRDEAIWTTVDTGRPVIQGLGPIISLGSPDAGIAVTVVDNLVDGYASGPAGVKMVVGDSVYDGVSSPTGGGTFIINPTLPEGVYDATLKATDNAGNDSIDLPSFKLNVDFVPPTVVIKEPSPGGKYGGGNAPTSVNFDVTDKAGLKFVGLQVDGNNIPLDLGLDASEPPTVLSPTVEIDGGQCPGTHSMVVTVTDVGDHTITPSASWTVGKIKGDPALAKHCKKIVCDQLKGVTKQAKTNYNTLRRQQRTLQRKLHGPAKKHATKAEVAAWKSQLTVLNPQVRTAKRALDSAKKHQRKKKC